MKKICAIFVLILVILSSISMNVAGAVAGANECQCITENTFIDLIKGCKQSIVRIIVSATSGPQYGTGFIVQNNDELWIITNKHVITIPLYATLLEIKAETVTGEELHLKVDRESKQADLAILSIADDFTPNKSKLKPLELGNSDKVEEGQWVLAIGNPLSLTSTASRGIVSAKSREISVGGYPHKYIQIDITIGFGSSGGPLLNLEREVVGIVVMVWGAAAAGVGNIGAAIPVNILKEELETKQSEARPASWLGINFEPADATLLEAHQHLPDTKGFMITRIAALSPAAKAKFENEETELQSGHIITHFNRKHVSEFRDGNELRRKIMGLEPGANVTLTIARPKKEPKDIILKAETKPKDKRFEPFY